MNHLLVAQIHKQLQGRRGKASKKKETDAYDETANVDQIPEWSDLRGKSTQESPLTYEDSTYNRDDFLPAQFTQPLFSDYCFASIPLDRAALPLNCFPQGSHNPLSALSQSASLGTI